MLRNVGALDMEASAFLHACEVTGVTALGVIKGVSDMGNGDKEKGNDQHYQQALLRAARAAKVYVRYKLDNMPRAVVDRGELATFKGLLTVKLN